MYCRNCGKFLNDEDKFCKYCGNKIIKEVVAVKEEKKEEKASIGWWFLAFFIPFIGFILFLIYRIDRKKRSKRLLSGTISGIVVFVISVITIISLLASLLTKGMYKCVQIESYNSMHYVKTSVLKLMDDEDANNGDFIISTDEICEYYDLYDIYGGEVKIEILVTRSGPWERSNHDEIKYPFRFPDFPQAKVMTVPIYEKHLYTVCSWYHCFDGYRLRESRACRAAGWPQYS